jgi:DNA-binding transcriptional regulator YiaG
MSSVLTTSDYSGEPSSSSDGGWGDPPAKSRAAKTVRSAKPKAGRAVKAKPVGRPSTKTAKAAKVGKAAKPARAAKAAAPKKATKPAAKTTRGLKAKPARATKAAPAKAKAANFAMPAKAVRGPNAAIAAKPAKTTRAAKAAAPKTARAASAKTTRTPRVAKPKVVKGPKPVDGRRRPTKKVPKVLPIPDKNVLAAIQESTPSGQAIKDFRIGINVNMRAFAELLGVNPATVFRWETNRTARIQASSQTKLKKLVANVINKKPVKIAG